MVYLKKTVNILINAVILNKLLTDVRYIYRHAYWTWTEMRQKKNSKVFVLRSMSYI